MRPGEDLRGRRRVSVSELAGESGSFGGGSKKSFAMAGLSKNCASCDDQVFGGAARGRDGVRD